MPVPLKDYERRCHRAINSKKQDRGDSRTNGIVGKILAKWMRQMAILPSITPKMVFILINIEQQEAGHQEVNVLQELVSRQSIFPSVGNLQNLLRRSS